MTNPDIVLGNLLWKTKIKQPRIYIKKKLAKLNKLNSFKKKSKNYTIFLTNNKFSYFLSPITVKSIMINTTIINCILRIQSLHYNASSLVTIDCPLSYFFDCSATTFTHIISIYTTYGYTGT